MINYTKFLSSILMIALVLISGCTDQTAPPLSENDGGGPASAIRYLPDDCIEQGAQFDVHITVSDYGMFGQVNETLCDGWTYVGSSLDPSQFSVAGNEVTFTFLGVSNFTYTVQAPSAQGECCTISGNLKDQDKVIYSVTGDSQVCTCQI